MKWHVEPGVFVANDKTALIAKLYPSENDNGMENARLIAAAPELYSVLNAIRTCMNFGKPVPKDFLPRIEEVLKKAEAECPKGWDCVPEGVS